MARRRKSSAAAQVVWLNWSKSPEGFADLFDLASEDWKAPDVVKVNRGQRYWTWSARFSTAAGERPLLVTRTRRDAAGDLEVVSRSVRWAWKISGAALRAAHPDAEAA